jgi:hypothetical protein
VTGFDGSGPGFNKEELEECDQSEYEITYVSWLDDKTHKVVRYVGIFYLKNSKNGLYGKK